MTERVRHAADDIEYEHRLLMPDQHIHLFAHSVQDKDGRLEYIGATQDVTRQRLAEKQLREGELNLRRIAQTIPGMLWSATPEGELDYCNRPSLDFTDMTAEQATGGGWTAAIYPDDRDSLIEQNVVERAVVLCDTETFVVEESWLKRESAYSPRKNYGLSALADREVQMIEAALAESHGRISGPSGAAEKLGIPRQTLEYKIQRLGLDKYGRNRPTSYGDK